MRIASLFALSAADRRLLIEAFATLLWVRLALRFRSVESLRAWASCMGGAGQPVGRVVWAVSAAGRRLPGTNCLSSAFATQRLLSRHGHESEVHIGVAKEDGRLAAHAWVVRDGWVLVDSDDHGAYTRLVAWPASAGGRRPASDVLEKP